MSCIVNPFCAQRQSLYKSHDGSLEPSVVDMSVSLPHGTLTTHTDQSRACWGIVNHYDWLNRGNEKLAYATVHTTIWVKTVRKHLKEIV